MLEAFVAAEVEHDHDGYDFGGGHAVSSKILPFAFRSFRSKGVDLDEFVKYFAEIVDFTENISNFV